MKFEVTILGSGSALPTSKRNCSAHLLNANERFLLFDCAEGTQAQLRRNKIKFMKINHIFISHMHGDHLFGLPGLLSTFELLGRKTPIHIYAPRDIRHLINLFKNQFSQHIFDIHLHYLHKNEIGEVIFEDKMIKVQAYPLKHRVSCWGFVVTEKQQALNLNPASLKRFKIPIKLIEGIKNGANFTTESGQTIDNKELTLPPFRLRSYAYFTDTLFDIKHAEYAKNTDLLYHEATFLKKDTLLAEKTFHSTTHQAATIAKKANVKKLLVGHFSSRYKDESWYEKETQEIFPNSIAVTEGKTYSIEQIRHSR